MARVSVVIPIYNSRSYLKDAIDSIRRQTYSDWELLAINEYGSDDGSAKIIEEYSQKDSRICLIQNTKKLGLAESLNKGIRLAKGEYIARLDADDLAHPQRFQKQVQFLDDHPNVIVCGTYQHHFGPETNWIHKPATSPEQCKANLLFFCDLCHSTLMLRKSALLEHGLFYAKEYLAEDFELWTRVVRVGEIANIPEVLGEYRWGEGNITSEKKEMLNVESGEITRKSLEQNLGFKLDPADSVLFQGWENPFSPEIAGEQRNVLLEKLEYTLRRIYEKNQEVKFYDSSALLGAIAAKWYWAKYFEPFNQIRNVDRIDEIFNASYQVTFPRRVIRFWKNNKGIRVKMKKIVKKLKHQIKKAGKKIYGYTPWGYIDKKLQAQSQELKRHINDMTWDRIQVTNNEIEKQTWELERHINDMTWDRAQVVVGELQNNRSQIAMLLQMNIEENFRKNMVPYYKGEKIRIVFYYQVASFWPSWDTFYSACLADKRLEVKLVYLKETVIEHSQMATAEEFLVRNKIDYINAIDFDIDQFRPHIMVYQTPYDMGHRKATHRSSAAKARGYRIVYIPYGIEITDTDTSRKAHFEQQVIINNWRLYTISERMRQDYQQFSEGGAGVRALGHPKFDGLFHKERFPLAKDIIERSAGKKIVLWKVHFPKIIYENGVKYLTTPNLKEYIAFANTLDEYRDFYFIFMPHPKLFEENVDEFIAGDLRTLKDILESKINIYIDRNDDYRNSLLNADYIIVDRSAVMVEAGAVGVPVLYMHNEEYQEALTAAVKPLIDSYYQGSIFKDMVDFIDMCHNNIDPKKVERENTFSMCIPFFDGKCGERIKNDLIFSLNEELQNQQ